MAAHALRPFRRPARGSRCSDVGTRRCACYPDAAGAEGPTAQRCRAANRSAHSAGTGPHAHGAGYAETAGSERSADGCTGPELRGAGSQTGRDARTENAKAQQCQGSKHQRHGIVERGLIAGKTLRELAEQCRADTHDDGDTKFSKNATKPISWLAACRIGLPASMPTCAIRPG